MAAMSLEMSMWHVWVSILFVQAAQFDGPNLQMEKKNIGDEKFK